MSRGRRRKTHEEFSSELYEKFQGAFIPLGKYKNNTTKINFFHKNCEQSFIHTPKQLLRDGRCRACSPNIWNYEKVKRFVETESNCELASKSYKNPHEDLIFICQCDNKFRTPFHNFRHYNKRRCDECGYRKLVNSRKLDFDFVKNQIENELDSGFILISQEYINNNTPLTIKCPEDHEFTKRYSDFKKGSRCQYCTNEQKSKNRRHDYSYIKSNIELIDGYKLLSKVYTNSKSKLNIKCPFEHEFEMAFSDFHFSKQRCPQCYLEDKRKNATSHIFVWLREQVSDWKKKSMAKDSYKCVVTNMPMNVVHHLRSFHLIAEETLESLSMPIYEKLSDYSDEQIELMKDKCIELHEKYGLGVCLTEEIHTIFHSAYGIKNNTPEQFEEFKVRYQNGEFEGLLMN